MKYIQIILLLILPGLYIPVKSQDLHFSQYFNAPLLINPANTGFNPDFDYRIGGNYRNQWTALSNFPYKTMSVWADAQLLTNRIEEGWLGVGGALLQDVAGSGNLTSTRAYASIAYHQMLGFRSLLSGGFNIGFTQKRIDLTKLTFNSQWNGRFFDTNIPSNEPFAFNQVAYFTLQAGINYAYFATDNLYLNIGASVLHANKPNETFFNANNANTRVEPRYNFFANATIRAGDAWLINPNVYYSTMANTSEITLGSLFQRDLSASRNGSLQLLAGIYYRVGDAIIPTIGFDIANTKITFNYDATTSSLRNYNPTVGAYEISLIKSGLYKGREKNVKCPTVKF